MILILGAWKPKVKVKRKFCALVFVAQLSDFLTNHVGKLSQ